MVDNKLAAAQRAIGESSNLAQLCQTYSYNFDDDKYCNYACILAVIAQIAIDSAKRAFDIDVTKEIMKIKNDMDIEENGLPDFWLITKKDKRKARTEEIRKEREKANKEKIKAKINHGLICPMNYVCGLNLTKFRDNHQTIPVEEFMVLNIDKKEKRRSKKVEELIEKYSIELHSIGREHNGDMWCENDDDALLQIDYEQLITDIRQIYISRNYQNLMSWLINRAFKVTPQTKGEIDSSLYKNKSLLLKVLYDSNPECFLKCFSKNVKI